MIEKSLSEDPRPFGRQDLLLMRLPRLKLLLVALTGRI